MWNKIKEVHVDKNDTNKLFYKYDLTESSYHFLNIQIHTRNSSSLSNLSNISNSLLKISKDKYNDLVQMCNTGVIISDHRNFLILYLMTM